MRIIKSINNTIFLLIILIVMGCFIQEHKNKTGNLHVSLTDNYHELKLSTDTSFYKYKTGIKEIISTSYPDLEKKYLLVRVFAMNCDICFENQLEIIRRDLSQENFGIIWVITAPNIRAYELFVKKYGLSKGSMYVPMRNTFTNLDEGRVTYYLIVSEKLQLDSPFIPQEEMPGLAQYIHTNFNSTLD